MSLIPGQGACCPADLPNLFVPTAANGDDVQKFSPTGTLLQVLADDGTLGGFPSGIALDSNGNIFVGRSPTHAGTGSGSAASTVPGPTGDLLHST